MLTNLQGRPDDWYRHAHDGHAGQESIERLRKGKQNAAVLVTVVPKGGVFEFEVRSRETK